MMEKASMAIKPAMSLFITHVKYKLNHVNHIVYTLNYIMETMAHGAMGYEDR